MALMIHVAGVDPCGAFHDQVKVLQEECDLLMNGVTQRFHVFLTGDGKYMEVSNKDVGGSKCWSCDKDDCLIPCPTIDGTIRWGAFLRGILCCRRICGCVHGCCRVATAFVKRLGATCLDWIQNDADDKRWLEELRALWHELVLDAQHIPHAQRLAPRPHKAPQMDLTAARLFWQCKEKQRNLVRILEPWYGHKTIGLVRVHTIVTTFLYAFVVLHTPFALRRPLVDAEVHQAPDLTSRVCKAWAALKWKPIRWVH